MRHSKAATRNLPWLLRVVPAFGSLKDYRWRELRADLLAGLTVAAVAVPQAMAYAMIAGLPVEYGLYTAIVMTFVGALFDSSRHLINGPTNAISIAMLSVLSPITTPETLVPTAILLAFVIGAIQLGITALRLGDLSRYISHSVILGFTTGASCLLVLDQLKNLVGVPGLGGGHDSFVVRFYRTWAEATAIHWPTAALGFGAVALILALRWLKRRLGWVLLPELLLAVIASASITSLWSLDTLGVKVVGAIPARLPSFALPEWSFERVEAMASGATAVALLGLLEALSMAKAIASHTRQHVDMNQQCLSEGIANLVGSFFQCFPGSGSLTRSAINQQAGAVSQWSGVFSAIAVALTMLLFAPLARYIPRAALAGILLVAAFKMVDFRSLTYYVRASRFDAVIVTATALSAVLISIEFCVLIGVLLSFVMAVPRVGHILLTEFVVSESGYVHERLPSDRTCPQIRIFGLEGEMFFAATASLDRALDQIEASITPQTRVVILRMKRARNPDAVGLSALDQFLVDVAARGVQVLICGVRSELLRSFERAGIVARVGKEHVFEEQPVRQTSTHLAVKHAYSLIETRCPECPLRARHFEATSYAI